MRSARLGFDLWRAAKKKKKRMCWFKIINVRRVLLSSIEQSAIKTFDNNEVGVGLRFGSVRRCGSQEGRGSDEEEENKQYDI